jgi:hypothetical protein
VEWQTAAVRVDAGPLDRAPAQAALRAVNFTFVRAEKDRFWLGCKALHPVGFNSFTLIEQAAEVHTRTPRLCVTAQALTRFASRYKAPSGLLWRRLF